MDEAALITSLITFFGLVVAIVTIRMNTSLHRRQMNAEVFMKYAERYEKVMSEFPSDAIHVRFDTENDLPPISPKLTLAVLKYLNLSSEEFYLWKRKYVANEVWKIWEHELVRMLQSPLIKREWHKLEQEFISYPEFLTFVADAQKASLPENCEKARMLLKTEAN